MLRATLFALTICAVGCDVTDPAPTQEGTVHLLQISGGCWVIDTVDPETGVAERLEPIDLDPQYRVEGLEITFTAEPLPTYASICMAGRIVRLEGVSAAGG
jgi:hypothetical protein